MTKHTLKDIKTNEKVKIRTPTCIESLTLHSNEDLC